MTPPITEDPDLPTNWTVATIGDEEIAFARSDAGVTMRASRTAFEPGSPGLPDQHVWAVSVEVDPGDEEDRRFVGSIPDREATIRTLTRGSEQVEALLSNSSVGVTAPALADRLDLRDRETRDPDVLDGWQ